MSHDHYKPNHNGNTPQERLAARLKNSGEGSCANETVKHGEGAQRTFHNLHRSGQRGPMSNHGGEGGKGPLDPSRRD